MDGHNPHIHVESKVVRGEAAVRNMLASTFGLAGDLPEPRHRRMRSAGAVCDGLSASGPCHLPCLP